MEQPRIEVVNEIKITDLINTLEKLGFQRKKNKANMAYAIKAIIEIFMFTCTILYWFQK